MYAPTVKLLIYAPLMAFIRTLALKPRHLLEAMHLLETWHLLQLWPRAPCIYYWYLIMMVTTKGKNNNNSRTMFILLRSWLRVIVWVHPVHVMNVEQRQTAADHWTKQVDLSHRPACRQLWNYIHHRDLLLLCLKADVYDICSGFMLIFSVCVNSLHL